MNNSLNLYNIKKVNKLVLKKNLFIVSNCE